MVPPAPAQILIGISEDPNDSKELLSRAINILAHPNDTIVAIHVIVSEKTKRSRTPKIDQSQFRRAKAFVISVLGEFACICQSKQVNLEAKVGFSSSIGKGLIEEAKAISADFLLVGGSRKQPNRGVAWYCFEHAPESCSLISIGKCKQLEQDSESNHPLFGEFLQLGSRWSNKSNQIERCHSAQKFVDDPITKREKPSPITVFDGIEREWHSTDEDSFSFEGSSITESPSPSLVAPKIKGTQSHMRKQPPRFKLLSSFLRSPFDLNARKRNENNGVLPQPLLRCFNYEEISNATNKFHPDNMVGLGGYSEVYRGDLDNGQTIAVKRLTKDNKEREFLTELGIIGHVCHPNTAKLVGCCIEKGFYLIFNFSPNGTLASALHGRTIKPLEWQLRYKIAMGVARGLHYLHKCCRHRIIHRDIKASNVLLGPDYEPQISDFGLAKWLPNKWTHHAMIPVEGTFGYLAPEYFMHGIVDEKTDVFAFGILLLEIITGRRPVDSSKQNLLSWAKPLMESGDITQLADPKLEGKYDMDQMRRLVLAGSHCVRHSSISRPSMTEVLELLIKGYDSETALCWRMPKEDCSWALGCEVPAEIILEDI